MLDSIIVPVNLSREAESTRIYFEATQLGPVIDGEVEVSCDELNLDDVCETISHVAKVIGATLEQLKAKRTVVEFGVEVAAEAGHLTALIVKGAGKANLKITVEWG